MKLIRIFIDTVFSKVADRFLGDSLAASKVDDGLVVDEAMFVDECRCHHLELSDDQLRMIYGLYRDEWSYLPEDLERDNIADVELPIQPNIFNVLLRVSHEVLRLNNGEPQVKFNNLFRWREITQNLGEDLLVSAFLAYNSRNTGTSHEAEESEYMNVDGIDFCSWPTILHNDNPHLTYIFKATGLCELHSHLNASTDNFTISWVSLMNNIKGLDKKFEALGKIHDESRYRYISTKMYSYVITGCALRLELWRLITGRNVVGSPKLDAVNSNPEYYASEVQNELSKEFLGDSGDGLDYISCDILSPMRVIGGERKFIYCVLKYILSHDDVHVSQRFYRYLLIKNRFRSFIVQVNPNKGFANFKRFQDLKSKFINKKYLPLVSRLAIWEASVFNYTDVFETRIVPLGSNKDKKNLIRDIDNISRAFGEDGKEPEWSILFHFIKRPENFNVVEDVRHGDLREKVQAQSVYLKQMLNQEDWEKAGKSYLTRIKGIDAASSEIGCRPEVFAHAFRYLKGAGYAATFHAGEDFYDIADGLRSIQEAISFLGLEAGDRIGHALALGIDPGMFYKTRNNYIALPVQWMLDNVVWLYFRSKEYNVALEPGTEHFLITTFRSLVRRIGYVLNNSEEKVGMVDYYQSMLLRGDDPELYDAGYDRSNSYIFNAWGYYDRQEATGIAEIRRWNKGAKNLLQMYLKDANIKRQGGKIASFVVPSGYPKLIRKIQDGIMREISKRQIGIECCPSSNYRIGYFRRFDEHPIFRFMPVKPEKGNYPLPVTVNTDDLGVFSTSLPNEYSLLALSLMKMKDEDGNHIYSSQEIYDWIQRIVENGYKYRFHTKFNKGVFSSPESHL